MPRLGLSIKKMYRVLKIRQQLRIRVWGGTSYDPNAYRDAMLIVGAAGGPVRTLQLLEEYMVYKGIIPETSLSHAPLTFTKAITEEPKPITGITRPRALPLPNLQRRKLLPLS